MTSTTLSTDIYRLSFLVPTEYTFFSNAYGISYQSKFSVETTNRMDGWSDGWMDEGWMENG